MNTILNKDSKILQTHKKSTFSTFEHLQSRQVRDTKKFIIVIDPILDKDEKISILLDSLAKLLKESLKIIVKDTKQYLRSLKKQNQLLTMIIADSSKKDWLYEFDKNNLQKQKNLVICIYHLSQSIQPGWTVDTNTVDTKIILYTNQIEQLQKEIQNQFTSFKQKQKILNHQLKKKKRFGYNLEHSGCLIIFYLKQFQNIKDFVKNHTMQSSKFKKTLFIQYSSISYLKHFLKAMPNHFNKIPNEQESNISSISSENTNMISKITRKIEQIKEIDKIIIIANDEVGKKIQKYVNKRKNCTLYVLDQYQKQQFQEKIRKLQHNPQYQRYLDLVHSEYIHILIDNATRQSFNQKEQLIDFGGQFLFLQNLQQIKHEIQRIPEYHQILILIQSKSYPELVIYLQNNDVKNVKIFLKRSSVQQFDKLPFLVGQNNQYIHFVKFVQNLRYDIEAYQDPIKILQGFKIQFLIHTEQKQIRKIVEEAIAQKSNMQIQVLEDFTQHLAYLISSAQHGIDYVVIAYKQNLKQILEKVHKDNQFKILLISQNNDQEYESFPEILTCVENLERLNQFIQGIQINQIQNAQQQNRYKEEQQKQKNPIKMTALKRMEYESFRFIEGINRKKIIIRVPNSMNDDNSIIMQKRLKITYKNNIQFKIYEYPQKLRDVEYATEPLSYIIVNDDHLKWFQSFLSHQQNESFKVILYTKNLIMNRNKLSYKRIKLITDKYKDIEDYINEEYERFLLQEKNQKLKIYGDFLLKLNQKLNIVIPEDEELKRLFDYHFPPEDINLVTYKKINQIKKMLEEQIYNNKAVIVLNTNQEYQIIKKMKYNPKQVRFLILQQKNQKNADNKNIFYLSSFDSVINWITEIPKEQQIKKKDLYITSLSCVDTDKKTPSVVIEQKFNAWHLQILKKYLKNMQSHQTLYLVCYQQSNIQKQLKSRKYPFIVLKNLLIQQNFQQKIKDIKKNKHIVLLKNQKLLISKPAELMNKYPYLKIINVQTKQMQEEVIKQINANQQRLRKKGCLFIFLSKKIQENVQSLIKDLSITQDYVIKYFENEKQLEEIYQDFPQQQSCLIILNNELSEATIQTFKRFITQKTKIIVKNTSEQTLSEIVFNYQMDFKHDEQEDSQSNKKQEENLSNNNKVSTIKINGKASNDQKKPNQYRLYRYKKGKIEKSKIICEQKNFIINDLKQEEESKAVLNPDLSSKNNILNSSIRQLKSKKQASNDQIYQNILSPKDQVQKDLTFQDANQKNYLKKSSLQKNNTQSEIDSQKRKSLKVQQSSNTPILIIPPSTPTFSQKQQSSQIIKTEPLKVQILNQKTISPKINVQFGSQTSEIIEPLDLSKQQSYFLFPKQLRYRKQLRLINRLKHNNIEIKFYKDLDPIFNDISKIVQTERVPQKNINLIKRGDDELDQESRKLLSTKKLEQINQLTYQNAIRILTQQIRSQLPFTVIHNLNQKYDSFIKQLSKFHIEPKKFVNLNQLQNTLTNSPGHQKIILTQESSQIKDIIKQDKNTKILILNKQPNEQNMIKLSNHAKQNQNLSKSIKNRVRFISQQQIQANIKQLYDKPELLEQKINVYYEQQNQQLQNILCKLTLKEKNINKYNLLPFENLVQLQILCSQNQNQQAILIINEKFQKQADELNRRYNFVKIIFLSEYKKKGGKYLNIQQFDFQEQLSNFLNLVSNNQKQTLQQVLFEFVNRSILTIQGGHQSKFMDQLFSMEKTKLNYSMCEFDPDKIEEFMEQASNKKIKECLLIIPEQSKQKIIKAVQNKKNNFRVIVVVRKDIQFKNKHIALTSIKTLSPYILKRIQSNFKINLLKNSTIFINSQADLINMKRNSKFNFNIKFFNQEKQLNKMIQNLPENHEAHLLKKQINPENDQAHYYLETLQSKKVNNGQNIKIFYQEKDQNVVHYLENIRKDSNIGETIFKSAADLNQQLQNYKGQLSKVVVLVNNDIIPQIKKVKQKHQDCNWVLFSQKMKRFDEKIFNDFVDKKGNLYVLVKGKILKNIDLKYIKDLGLNINIYQYTDFQEVQSYLTNIENSKLLVFCQQGQENLLSKITNPNAFIFELQKQKQNQSNQVNTCNFYLKKLIERISKQKNRNKNFSKNNNLLRPDQNHHQVSNHNKFIQDIVKISSNPVLPFDRKNSEKQSKDDSKQRRDIQRLDKSISLELSSGEQQMSQYTQNKIKPDQYIITTIPTIPILPDNHQYGNFKIDFGTTAKKEGNNIKNNMSKVSFERDIIGSIDIDLSSIYKNMITFPKRLFVETIMQNERIFILIKQNQQQLIKLIRSIQKNNERIKIIEYNDDNLLNLCNLVDQTDSAVIISDINKQAQLDRIVRSKINFKLILKNLNKMKKKYENSVKKFYINSYKSILELILSIPRENYMFNIKKNYKYLVKQNKVTSINFYYQQNYLPSSVKLQILKFMIQNPKVLFFNYDGNLDTLINLANRSDQFFYIISKEVKKLGGQQITLPSNVRIVSVFDKYFEPKGKGSKHIQLKNFKEFSKMISDINLLLQNENIQQKLINLLDNNVRKQFSYYNQNEIDGYIRAITNNRLKSINSKTRITLPNELKNAQFSPKNYKQMQKNNQNQQSQHKRDTKFGDKTINQIKLKLLQSIKKYKKFNIMLTQNLQYPKEYHSNIIKYKDIRCLINLIKQNLNTCLLIYLENAENIIEIQNEIILNEKIYFMTKQNHENQLNIFYDGRLIQFREIDQIDNLIKDINGKLKKPTLGHKKMQQNKKISKRQVYKYYMNKDLIYLKQELLKQTNINPISVYSSINELLMNIILTNTEDERIIIMKKKEQVLYFAPQIQNNYKIDIIQIQKKENRNVQLSKLIQSLKYFKCIKSIEQNRLTSSRSKSNRYQSNSPSIRTNTELPNVFNKSPQAKGMVKHCFSQKIL